MKKITNKQLNKIINEVIDHQSISDIVEVASKLLTAIEVFKKDANVEMVTSIDLDTLIKSLENMVTAPESYIEKKINKITLKQIKQ